MLKEAIEEIVSLTKQSNPLALTQDVAGTYDGADEVYTHKILAHEYGRNLGDILTPYRPTVLQVTTLTGFLDAVKAGTAARRDAPEGNLGLENRVVHVEDHLTVALKSAGCDSYGVRDVLIRAKYTPQTPFQFDNYYGDPQRFIIALQVSFLNTDELLTLVKIASSLKSGKSVHVQDDGFSQTVLLKSGEVTTAEVNIKPRIKLIPKRTFDEAAPVESEFLIRFRQTAEETPAIALFDIEGTKWQGDSMRAIKKYLEENLDEKIPVLA